MNCCISPRSNNSNAAGWREFIKISCVVETDHFKICVRYLLNWNVCCPHFNYLTTAHWLEVIKLVSPLLASLLIWQTEAKKNQQSKIYIWPCFDLYSSRLQCTYCLIATGCECTLYMDFKSVCPHCHHHTMFSLAARMGRMQTKSGKVWYFTKRQNTFPDFFVHASPTFCEVCKFERQRRLFNEAEQHRCTDWTRALYHQDQHQSNHHTHKHHKA